MESNHDVINLTLQRWIHQNRQKLSTLMLLMKEMSSFSMDFWVQTSAV